LKRLLTLLLLAVASAALVAGCGSGESSDDSSQTASGSGPVKPEIQAERTAATLKSTDDWGRFKIKKIEPNNGGFTVQTSLPPGQNSIAAVDQLCQILYAGDPPMVKASQPILVFGTGPEPLSGKSCGQGP